MKEKHNTGYIGFFGWILCLVGFMCSGMLWLAVMACKGMFYLCILLPIEIISSAIPKKPRNNTPVS